MFDARDILGRLTQTGLTPSADRRLEHALSPAGMAGSGNPLGDLLGGLLGGDAQSGGGGLAGGILGGLGGLGGLGDIARQAESMLGGASRSVQSGNPLAVGGLAALAGALFGGGGGAAKGAVGAGLLAVLGSIAFRALQDRQTGTASGQAPEKAEVPLGLREPQTPAEEERLQQTATLAIRAMINAAKADGAIDGGEMARIMDKLKDMGAEERNFVLQELSKPLDLDGLVRDVAGVEQAVQVYGASLLAIDVDTEIERDYLRRLAERLGLDAPTVESIHEAFGLAPATF